MAAAATIPLECRLCPKKPDFSDVSHLLTHVASKAHLSRYYQMKVKGSADIHSRTLVDDYDDWYERYSIDDLMRDRLAQKDKKGGGARSARNASTAATRHGSAATISSRSTPAASAQGGRRAAPRPLRDSVLNPQLEPRVKIEPMSRSGTPLSYLSSVDSAIFAGTRYAPPSWPNSPYAGTPMKEETMSTSDEDDDDPFTLDPLPLPPRFYNPRVGRNSTGTNTGESIITYDDFEEDTVGETTSDVAKLKGLVWPGMAMFDSATPDMRRKRNQKKDYSVIEQLQATSEWVMPNEMIFDHTGTLRKEREITGNPEDDEDSLLSGEAEPEPDLQPPTKKRQTRKPRQALVEKNRNTGRVTRQRTGGSHHPGGSSRRQTLGRANGPYFGAPPRDDDDDLTFGPSRPRKRTGLSIHRDNTGPDITFDQPASMNYLTSSFRNPLQNNNSRPAPPLFAPSNANLGHQRLPSFGYSGSAFGGNAFRPSSNGGMGNFASFGGLNTQTLFQHNPFPTTNGAAAMSAFHQQFGTGPQQSFGNTGMFAPQNPGHNRGYSQGHGSIDLLTGLNYDVGVATGVDHSYQGSTELNPLFFSSNQPTPRDDDEATVSPPNSDREQR
ncbi:hypothetical protein LTR17_026943 [Elasticomyces elasticus]|nr:hypothetical protein LTR17_026943 [Elasticomyces elasticus]